VFEPVRIVVELRQAGFRRWTRRSGPGSPRRTTCGSWRCGWSRRRGIADPEL